MGSSSAGCCDCPGSPDGSYSCCSLCVRVLSCGSNNAGPGENTNVEFVDPGLQSSTTAWQLHHKSWQADLFPAHFSERGKGVFKFFFPFLSSKSESARKI